MPVIPESEFHRIHSIFDQGREHHLKETAGVSKVQPDELEHLGIDPGSHVPDDTSAFFLTRGQVEDLQKYHRKQRRLQNPEAWKLTPAEVEHFRRTMEEEKEDDRKVQPSGKWLHRSLPQLQANIEFRDSLLHRLRDGRGDPFKDNWERLQAFDVFWDWSQHELDNGETLSDDDQTLRSDIKGKMDDAKRIAKGESSTPHRTAMVSA